MDKLIYHIALLKQKFLCTTLRCAHCSEVIFFVTIKILWNQNLKTASTGSSITPIKYFAFPLQIWLKPCPLVDLLTWNIMELKKKLFRNVFNSQRIFLHFRKILKINIRKFTFLIFTSSSTIILPIMKYYLLFLFRICWL